jgi:hypothetical protein
MQIRPTTRGNIVPVTLAASAIMGLLSSFGFLVMTVSNNPEAATMELTPRAAVVSVGDRFTATVEVASPIPVNAFTGVVSFDPTELAVEKIDYNTSIADLWAEAPWYKNGAGTIHFAGGTTQTGGFTGRGTLITVTFMATKGGESPVTIKDASILKHDGMGSQASLTTPIDSLFTITTPPILTNKKSTVTVRDPLRTGDLNNDGAVTMTDVSIFFMYVTTLNKKGDLNQDGKISTSDLSILIGQM